MNKLSVSKYHPCKYDPYKLAYISMVKVRIMSYEMKKYKNFLKNMVKTLNLEVVE